MKNKYITTFLIGFFLFSSCYKKKETLILKVGVIAGPEYKLAQMAREIAKKKYNLTVELISFNDYTMPNQALYKEEIDLNIFQHNPFLEEQVKKRNYNFSIVGKTFNYPMGIYSKKIKSLSELKNGAKILVPNDSTNEGRALLLLERAKLITLKAHVGLLPTVMNIKENPKKLEIKQLDASAVARNLEDGSCTLAIINSNFAIPNGLIPSRDALFLEGDDCPYVNLIVSRDNNKEDKKVKDFKCAYQSKEVETLANEIFRGGAIKAW